MPTDCLFRDDSYLRECQARVLTVTDQGGAVLGGVQLKLMDVGTGVTKEMTSSADGS